jgi:hypothetical protein
LVEAENRRADPSAWSWPAEVAPSETEDDRGHVVAVLSETVAVTGEDLDLALRMSGRRSTISAAANATWSGAVLAGMNASFRQSASWRKVGSQPRATTRRNPRARATSRPASVSVSSTPSCGNGASSPHRTRPSATIVSMPVSGRTVRPASWSDHQE